MSEIADNVNAMELQQNGSWKNVEAAVLAVPSEREGRGKKAEPFEAQAELYKKYKKLNESRPKNLNPEKQFEVRRK